MRLSPLEEYGLRCLIQLAQRGQQSSQPVTIRQIAESEGLSTAYVGKLMFLLQRAELVHSTRGVQGGYGLARPAGDLSLYEIFEALDPGTLDDVCEKFTGTESACVHTGACAIKHVWHDLNEHVNSYLRGHNLAEMAGLGALTKTPA